MHSIYRIRKNQYGLIRSIYVKESSRQFRAQSIGWGANVPRSLINRGSSTGLRRQSGRGYARIVRERKREKNRGRKFTFGGAESGAFSAVTGSRRRLRLLWRTIGDGADVGTAAGSPGRVGQCVIAIRLIRAGRCRRPVVFAWRSNEDVRSTVFSTLTRSQKM